MVLGATRPGAARRATAQRGSLRDATGAPDIFSICLSETVGAMVLGGALPNATVGGNWSWIPYTGGGSYGVALHDIRIAGASIGVPHIRYYRTIVDSGTTFMYLPPDAYSAVKGHFRSHCPWGSCSSRSTKGEYK